MTEALHHRVAAEVRAEMARQHVSQQALAGCLELTQAAVSRRLTGKVPFDMKELERVAAFLGVPVNNFMHAPERLPAESTARAS